MITLASLFDGIGGAPLCAVMCGAVPVWASEIEKFPIRVTEQHFPGMKHYGDITKIDGRKVEPVDIIVGGAPCQDLSVAGKRAGMKHSALGDDETTRSGLFMEQIRVIKEMRSHGTNQPRFMVYENVPGVFSSNGGEDFRAVLEETARIADTAVSIPRSPSGWASSGSILGDGFSLSWRVIDAQYFGVPQRRRRIYLVADFGGQSAPEILFEREGLPWHPATGGTQGEGTTGTAAEGVGATGIHGGIAGTLDGNYFRGCGERGGTEREVICTEEGVESAIGFNEFKSASADPMPMEDTMPTLEARNVGNVAEPYCMAPAFSKRPGQQIATRNDGLSYAVTTGDPPRVCDMGEIVGTIKARGQSIEHLSETLSRTVFECIPYDKQQYGKYGNGVVANTISRHEGTEGSVLVTTPSVRRLTPLECERLQGYPDNWTNISGASDANRYRALGNSFAIPCAYFVISGCVEAMEET